MDASDLLKNAGGRLGSTIMTPISLVLCYINVFHICFNKNITSQRRRHNDITENVQFFLICRYVRAVMIC